MSKPNKNDAAAAPGPAGQEPAATPENEQVQPAIYRNIWLFAVAFAVICSLFVLVLFKFHDEPVLVYGLLAALLSFLFTGLLGGFGVFRNERGYITGAGAILLMSFGVFYGAIKVDQTIDIGKLKESIEDKDTRISELSEDNEKLVYKINKLRGEVKRLEDKLAEPTRIALSVACENKPGSEDYFKVADYNASGPRHYMGVPQEMHPDSVSSLLLYVNQSAAEASTVVTPDIAAFRQVTPKNADLSQIGSPALKVQYDRGRFSIKILTPNPLTKCLESR